MIPPVYWSIDPRLNSERIVEWCNSLIRFESCSEEEKKWILERKCSNLKSSSLQHLLRMWGNDLGSLKEWVHEGCKQLKIEGEGKSMQEVIDALKAFQSSLPPEDKGFLSSESESDD